MKLWHVWARKMYADGKSQTEIARMLCKSLNTVRWALDINGDKERVADRIRAQRSRRRKPELSVQECANRGAHFKALWANPEFRAKKVRAASVQMKQRRADPIFDAKVRQASSAHMKAVHAAARKLAELKTAAQ